MAELSVQSDQQPLQSIWKKSIVSASPRLQRLLLRLAHYDLNIEFLRGKENVIADALSRVCPLQSSNSKTKDSNIDVIPVHHISQTALVSKTRLQELRLATQSDPTLSSLAKTIYEGWPQSKKDCPEQLLDFLSFRQEISEEDGLLYKNQRLIMPHSERLETLKVLHLGHYVVDKMQLRALETVYWPRINKDILKHYQSCKTCIKYSKSQRSEPLQSHPTPEVLWHTVATDLFKTKNSKYLLIVDYDSRFPVLRKLGSTTSRVLVQEMKAVFAKLGVPNIKVLDGGPQYTSAEFKDFTKHWQIEHRVSSPRNPQSNGMAECCIQTMKASLIKTIEEGEDVDLALLTYKTTPLNHRLPSPAELLNSRKYKTITNLYSTNKTARELQTDHGPRKASTGTNVQQEHLSATKTPAVSESCGST